MFIFNYDVEIDHDDWNSQSLIYPLIKDIKSVNNETLMVLWQNISVAKCDWVFIPLLKELETRYIVTILFWSSVWWPVYWPTSLLTKIYRLETTL